MTRTLRAGLEEKYGKLPQSNVLLEWCICHAAFLLCRFGPRPKTGRTGFKTAMGVDYIGELHELGANVYIRATVRPKNALD